MKTKLLAVMMMGLATVGSIGGVTLAQETTPKDYAAPNFGGGFGNSDYSKGVAVSGTKDGQKGDSLIGVVKSAINWVLGILSLIVLVLLLWGGFQMITAAGDDAKYKKGFTILKQAGIGLAFIALAWLIVSLIFFVIQGSGAAGNNAAQVNTAGVKPTTTAGS